MPTTSLRRTGGLWLLVGIYAGLSLVTLALWSARGVYSVTGDEPHYLVIADSILRLGSLELTQAYLDEFASRSIYALGLADPGTAPMAPFAHVLVGPNGLFSWHGAGVAVLVAPGFALAGVLGAKVTMIALGALVVVLAWRIAEVVLPDPRLRFWAVLAVAVGYPLVPAATQVYPDLLAGTLALGVVYLLLTLDRPRSRWSLAGYSVLIGFLPWLGTKFALPAAVLGVAVVLLGYRRWRSWSAVAWLAWPALVLAALLAAFHLHAFGSITGPPADGAFEASATSLMVLGGLLLDQDQGILLQNPVLWVGLLGLGPFLARYRATGLVWLAVFASIWIPGAAHVGWYGLGSMVGRYSWALAVLAIVPALIGLARIAEWSRRAFGVVVGLGIAVNAGFLAWGSWASGATPGAPAGFDLFTKPAGTWLESYAIFYFPVQRWFPALYDVDWAYAFWPNAAWLLLVVAVVVLGVRPRVGRWLVLGLLPVIVLAGIVGRPGPRTEVVALDVQGASAPGFLVQAPIRQMRQGPYTWSVSYASPSPEAAVVGRWELIESVTGAVAAAGELPGTGDAVATVDIPVPYFSLQPREYSLRVATYGTSPLRIVSTGVRHG